MKLVVVGFIHSQNGYTLETEAAIRKGRITPNAV